MSSFAKYRDYVRRHQAGDESVLEEMSPILEAVLVTLFVALLVILATVAYLNVQPYAVVADKLIQGVRFPAGIELLSKIPFLGGFVDQIKNFVGFGLVGLILFLAWSKGGFKAFLAVGTFLLIALLGGLQVAIGAFLWLIVQILEVLPFLISLDQLALRGALRHSSAIEGLVGGKEPRNSRDRSIIDKLRGIPFFFIRWAVVLAVIAYALDLLIGIAVYPPASSFEIFSNAVSIGDWASLDFENCIKLVVMLFSFELLLILVLIVWQWISTRKQGAEA